MDVGVYVVLVLQACCTLGLANTDFDAVVGSQDGDLLQDYKRSESQNLVGAFPDQKFRHIGLGKRTLDFIRYQSQIGKRLNLLHLIKDNLDKSHETSSFREKKLPFKFGTRMGLIRRSLRNRQNALRMNQRAYVGTRGRRQKLDPYMYLIGVGK